MKTNSLSIPSFQDTCSLAMLAVALLAVARPAFAHDHAHGTGALRQSTAGPAKTVAAKAATAMQLPALPKGVTEIRFGDFFVRPVGPLGVKLTKQVRELDGRRVRILGYMVNQEEAPPGRFLFSPMPGQQVHEHDNGLADDLPASTVFVSVPTMPNAPVPFVPGLMLLTGTLSVGSQTEPDGRISIVRLALDPPSKFGHHTSLSKNLSAPPGKGAERLAAKVSSKENSRP